MACNVSMHQSRPSADGHRITQHAGPPVLLLIGDGYGDTFFILIKIIINIYICSTIVQLHHA